MTSTDETGSGEKGRRPAVFLIVGVAATLIVTSAVAVALVAGGHQLSKNAPLIGAVIALGGVFTAQLVGIALEDVRTRQARELEVQRAREAAELENRRAREVALQRYFEDVGELLIEKPLRRAGPGDNLSTVVRAQTLSVLVGCHPDRKRILLLFLYESGLIDRRKPVLDLKGADLNGADLSGAALSVADLRGAALSGAMLRRTNLSVADLREADLSGANLSGANLFEANLFETHLIGADLSGAILIGADLSGAALSVADLRGAALSGAILSGAALSGANLFEADLSGADLSGAMLRGTNLSGARGIEDGQLEKAFSLEGCTMPDGFKHL